MTKGCPLNTLSRSPRVGLSMLSAEFSVLFLFDDSTFLSQKSFKGKGPTVVLWSRLREESASFLRTSLEKQRQ